jgi:DnaJ-class molecular chaperone
MQSDTMMRNANGKWIDVDAKGMAYCESCTGEYDIDDMKDKHTCITCHNDLHCDDWTMEDC